MKTHTSNFKNAIKTFGRQIDSKITYTLNGTEVELGGEILNSITPTFKADILKSVMKELDIDSNIDIPVGTILRYQFGVLVGSEYEYIDFGNYVVYSSERQEDTYSYKIVCYDKMLYSMVDYEKLNITYPITIRNYINAICNKLGIQFANASGTFANYDKEIKSELYEGLGYTFRDVLDELAQVTASTICINKDDKLEIRYINNTNDTIDEEFLKDINVTFGEKYGAINTIVLSRSAGSDNVYYPATLPQNPVELKISDNQIMNGNDRSDYLPDIYNKLNGLEYYINDFASTGICYYDVCDRYNVKIGDNTYSCVMFNDEIEVTQGLVENVYTEMPQGSETDYTKADKTDRKINQAYLIVDKQNSKINAVVDTVEDITTPIAEITNCPIHIEDAENTEILKLTIYGESKQNEIPTPDTPEEIRNVKPYNILDFDDFLKNAEATYTSKNGVYSISAINKLYTNKYQLNLKPNTHYILHQQHQEQESTNVRIDILKNGTTVGDSYSTDKTKTIYRFQTDDSSTYTIRGNYSNKSGNLIFNKPILHEGTVIKEYLPYQNIGIKILNKNLLEKWDIGKYISSSTGLLANSATSCISNTIEIDTNNTYRITNLASTLYNFVAFYDNNSNYIGRTSANAISTRTFTKGFVLNNGIALDENAKYMIINVYQTSATTGIIDDVNNFDTQIEINNNTSFSKNETNLYTINIGNNELCNIGDVKDELIIENGKAKIIKRIGKVVLDGSENWTKGNYPLIGTTQFYIPKFDNFGSTSPSNIISSHFINKNVANGINIGTYFNFFPTTNIATTITQWKLWLSTHNTTVYYQLATPSIIELEDISINLFNGVNNIELLATLISDMNLTYVRNNSLNSYIEGQIKSERTTRTEQIAQLEITDSEIKEEVGTIRNDLYTGLEQRISANEATLKLQEKSFDSDGNVKQVIVKQGMTFDENGLLLYSELDDYSSRFTTTGTIYKDGDAIVGQYTKDGSKQKDLELFGLYKYGKKDINDNAMFVGQLYTKKYDDGSTEEGFGHFYNGGNL